MALEKGPMGFDECLDVVKHLDTLFFPPLRTTLKMTQEISHLPGVCLIEENTNLFFWHSFVIYLTAQSG